VASVLLADHQTTGGYPKIATILSSDLDGVAQLRPGDTLAFQAVTAEEAVRIVRAQALARHDWLRELAWPRGGVQALEARLWCENLVSGMVRDGEDVLTSPAAGVLAGAA
jgi:allophanate hydrolase